MIITKTPFRISFAGGGTDLSEFHSREYGAVVSTAIDKYMYIALHTSFEPAIVLKYRQTEHVASIAEIRHPLMRELLRICNVGAPIEITSFADIPATGSGLASSSAFAVGVIKALHAHNGKEIGSSGCARMACEVEIERLGEPIGKQDQYAVAHGGLNYIRFEPDGSVLVEPIVMSRAAKEKLQGNLLLFFTGIGRDARTILEEQKRRMVMDAANHHRLRQMREFADQLRERLESGDIGAMGEILHCNWMLKRTLADAITSPEIDAWYERGRRAGATGGKILGAGGGGFLLFYCPLELQDAVAEELAELRRVDFRFESFGTRTIYLDS